MVAEKLNEAAVAVVRFLLILIGFALLPFYGLWLLCGKIADRIGQRRCRN